VSFPGGHRRSVAYFPSRDTGVLPVTGNGWFLARDIPRGIMPSHYAPSDESYTVALQPEDEQRADWLTTFLHIGQFEPHSLRRAVADFVETAANYLGHYGEVYFEIATTDAGQPLALEPLPRGRILRTPTSYLQLIPKPDRQYHDGRRCVRITPESIWHVRLPRELGTPRSHRRLLRRLSALSPLGTLLLHNPGGIGVPGYDFGAHRDASERLQEKLMRQWGTFFSKQRPPGPSTEYFFIARRLAFLTAQARVREHLLAELNALLARLAIAHRIVVTGIPAARDIETMLERLHNGEVGFKEALDSTRT
jgi:hypothetical protein